MQIQRTLSVDAHQGKENILQHTLLSLSIAQIRPMNHDYGTQIHSSSLVNWMIVGLVLVAAYFVIGEHWVHIAPYFPFLIFLACPLMHLFMHHGHGHHHDSSNSRTPPPAGGSEETRS